MSRGSSTLRNRAARQPQRATVRTHDGELHKTLARSPPHGALPQEPVAADRPDQHELEDEEVVRRELERWRQLQVDHGGGRDAERIDDVRQTAHEHGLRHEIAVGAGETLHWFRRELHIGGGSGSGRDDGSRYGGHPQASVTPIASTGRAATGCAARHE